MEQQNRWCIFTSAGDHNAIRLWLQGDVPRRWDLIVAYYGDSDHEFAEINKISSNAFRAKGGKFQILKKLMVQSPRCLDQYSHVWVCDDDIRMSGAQINEAFATTEFFKFWIAQPSFLQEGKISHLITLYAGPQCDYRIVNFIEENAPIFRRVKLIEFLRAYDGSLTGWGIDYWYLNLFGESGMGRFAIIDKVTVINPRDEEKGGSELDRLQSLPLRLAAWREAKAKYGLVEIHPVVFADCKIPSQQRKAAVTRLEVVRETAIRLARKLARLTRNIWVPERFPTSNCGRRGDS
jgi:hypothetical protein